MSSLDEFEEDDEDIKSKSNSTDKQHKRPPIVSDPSESMLQKGTVRDHLSKDNKSTSRPLTDALEYKAKRAIPPEMKSIIKDLIAEEFVKFKADVYANLSIPKEAPTNQDALNRVLGLLNWEVLITKINALADDDYLKMTLPAPSPSKTTPGKGKVHRRLKHITINLLELIRAEVTNIFSET